MASLAACSTGGGGFSRAWKGTEIGGEGADTQVRPYMARRWVVRRAVGQGAQGRLESRPQARKPAPHHGGQECQRHTRRLLVSRGGKSSQADHRQDCRCGTQDCVLHAEAGMASLAACCTGGAVGAQARGWADRLGRPYKARHWVAQREVGKGCPGRLESRPQARKPGPHHGGQECQRHTRRLLVSRGGKSSQADHRHDCRCGTQDCVLHAEAGMARLAACSTEGPVWQAWRRAARGPTVWHV